MHWYQCKFHRCTFDSPPLPFVTLIVSLSNPVFFLSLSLPVFCCFVFVIFPFQVILFLISSQWLGLHITITFLGLRTISQGSWLRPWSPCAPVTFPLMGGHSSHCWILSSPSRASSVVWRSSAPLLNKLLGMISSPLGLDASSGIRIIIAPWFSSSSSVAGWGPRRGQSSSEPFRSRQLWGRGLGPGRKLGLSLWSTFSVNNFLIFWRRRKEGGLS